MKRLLGSRFWQDERMRVWDFAVLILLGFFLFMFGNGHFTLFDNSEPHYSRVTQELAHNVDKLTLTFNGSPWYVHPPLYFWMTWATTAVFGWGEWVLRAWEGIFGILGLLVVYQLGSTFFNRRTGLVAAVILASSLYYMVLSRLAIFDTILNTFILFSAYMFLRGVYQPQNRGMYFTLAGVSTGLAILTKGPIGLVQPGVVAILFLMVTGQWSVLKDWRLWTGILIGVAIGAPWYAYELITQGRPFFMIALKDYTWYRFFGSVEGQGGPWYFYFPMLLGFFPWIMYLPSTIFQAVKHRVWKPETSADAVMLFSWIFMIFTFIFFSLAQTKLPNYIISLFPFLSLMIAHALLHVHEKPLMGWTTMLFPASASACLIASTLVTIPQPYHSAQPLVVAFFAILSIGGWLYALTFLKHRLAAVGIGVTTMVAISFYLTQTILPAYEAFKEPALLVKAIQQEFHQPYVLVNVNSFSPYMKFYLDRSIPDVDNVQAGIKMADRLASPGEPRLLVIEKSQILELEKCAPGAKVVSETMNKALVVIR